MHFHPQIRVWSQNAFNACSVPLYVIWHNYSGLYNILRHCRLKTDSICWNSIVNIIYILGENFKQISFIYRNDFNFLLPWKHLMRKYGDLFGCFFYKLVYTGSADSQNVLYFFNLIYLLIVIVFHGSSFSKFQMQMILSKMLPYMFRKDLT